MLVLVLVDVLGLGSLFRLESGFVPVLAMGWTAGAIFGLVLWLCMSQTAWPSYMLIRGWLAFHRHLPWLLMSFLADAHRRGVLRQAGAVYQFRHIELQHRLANRAVNEVPHRYTRPPRC